MTSPSPRGRLTSELSSTGKQPHSITGTCTLPASPPTNMQPPRQFSSRTRLHLSETMTDIHEHHEKEGAQKAECNLKPGNCINDGWPSSLCVEVEVACCDTIQGCSMETREFQNHGKVLVFDGAKCTEGCLPEGMPVTDILPPCHQRMASCNEPPYSVLNIMVPQSELDRQFHLGIV